MATVAIIPVEDREVDLGHYDAHTRDGAYIGSFPTPAYAAAEAEMVAAMEDMVFHMPRPHLTVSNEQLIEAYDAFIAQYDPEARCFTSRSGILRSEPASRAKKTVVAHVAGGLRAAVLDEHDDGDWFKVRVGDDEGWIQRTALHMPIRDRAQSGLLLAMEERLSIRMDRVVVRGEQGSYTIYASGDCYCRDSTRQDRHQLTMGWCKHVIACDLVGRAQDSVAAAPVVSDTPEAEEPPVALAPSPVNEITTPVVEEEASIALPDIAPEPAAEPVSEPAPVPAAVVAAVEEAPQEAAPEYDPLACVILPLHKLAGLWFYAFIHGGQVVIEMEDGRLTVILGDVLEDAATVQGCEGTGRGSITLTAAAFSNLWDLFKPFAKTACRGDTRLVNVFLDLAEGEVLYSVQDKGDAHA